MRELVQQREAFDARSGGAADVDPPIASHPHERSVAGEQLSTRGSDRVVAEQPPSQCDGRGRMGSGEPACPIQRLRLPLQLGKLDGHALGIRAATPDEQTLTRSMDVFGPCSHRELFSYSPLTTPVIAITTVIMSTPTPKPITRTTRREATIVLRFAETISEVYEAPAPQRPSVFPSRPGLAKVAPVIQLRRVSAR